MHPYAAHLAKLVQGNNYTFGNLSIARVYTLVYSDSITNTE